MRQKSYHKVAPSQLMFVRPQTSIHYDLAKPFCLLASAASLDSRLLSCYVRMTGLSNRTECGQP